jgi:hypothetical protein
MQFIQIDSKATYFLATWRLNFRLSRRGVRTLLARNAQAGFHACQGTPALDILLISTSLRRVQF